MNVQEGGGRASTTSCKDHFFKVSQNKINCVDLCADREIPDWRVCTSLKRALNNLHKIHTFFLKSIDRDDIFSRHKSRFRAEGAVVEKNLKTYMFLWLRMDETTPNWVMFLYKSSSSPVGGERTGRPRSLLSTAVGGRSSREAFPHPADARSVDSRPSGDDDRSRESCSPERSTREVSVRSTRGHAAHSTRVHIKNWRQNSRAFRRRILHLFKYKPHCCIQKRI